MPQPIFFQFKVALLNKVDGGEYDAYYNIQRMLHLIPRHKAPDSHV